MRDVTKSSNSEIDFQQWAAATGDTEEDVKAAWMELLRRGLVSRKSGNATALPLAMRRATSDTERRLAAHLSGYLLTENSFIVRRAGEPPGLPSILNTRIT